MSRRLVLYLLIPLLSSAQHLAWVVESQAFTDAVRARLVTKWNVEYCGNSSESCSGDPAQVRAVVGRVDVLNLDALPSLALAQSASFYWTEPSRVPSQAAIANVGGFWPAHGDAQIAEWVIAAIFEQQYTLTQRAERFRACAFSSSAAAGCEPASVATNHTMVSDLTIGVLGYGGIGKAVAMRAAALGATVIATKRHGPFTPTPAGLKWLSNDNDQLYREADVVVSCVPLSARGLLNATAFGLMKADALVIPISAGPVDYDALLDSLLARPAFRAVLDLWPEGCWHYPNVTCGAPLGAPNWPSHLTRLSTLPNVLPLPGMAMRDMRFWDAAADAVADNLDRLATGKPLMSVVRNASAD